MTDAHLHGTIWPDTAILDWAPLIPGERHDGLPDGWVTDVPGVTRTEQLALLGNGVIPPQAVAALLHLLA